MEKLRMWESGVVMCALIAEAKAPRKMVSATLTGHQRLNLFRFRRRNRAELCREIGRQRRSPMMAHQMMGEAREHIAPMGSTAEVTRGGAIEMKQHMPARFRPDARKEMLEMIGQA